MAEILSKISARTYAPGTRLPSVRAQSRALSVSVSTVVEAYGRLAAQGVITSRLGSGFYVAGPLAPLSLAEIGPTREREVDPLWVSRQSLQSDGKLLKPGCGWLPPTWVYETGVRRALRSAARATPEELTEYATPLGDPTLRQHLARRLAQASIGASPQQILLTESGTQAIDLICRFLLEPGNTVLVDDPCYFNFHALLKAHRVNVVGVPYTPHGPDLQAFAAALKAHSPRLYLTNSGVHNPTGAVVSSVTAHQLLKLADGSDLVIIEDDIYADFEVTPAPRLAAFDGLSRVIHIGSFSKTISAAIRCGYIACRPEWIESLLDLKLATSFGGGRLAASVLLSSLTDSGYRRHMEGIRLRLSQARAKLIPRLAAVGIVPWLVPESGMFLWCKLPERTDAAAVAQTCAQEHVILAPGNVFSQSLSAGQFLRFNVAQCSNDRVLEVLSRALGSSVKRTRARSN